MTSRLHFLQFFKIISKHVCFFSFYYSTKVLFFKIYYNKYFKICPRFLNFYVAQDDVTIYIKVEKHWINFKMSATVNLKKHNFSKISCNSTASLETILIKCKKKGCFHMQCTQRMFTMSLSLL
jgi:hypothetical protein